MLFEGINCVTAAYLGVKELVPPYLDQALGTADLITGVCFASAGSGYDPFTAKIRVGNSSTSVSTH